MAGRGGGGGRTFVGVSTARIMGLGDPYPGSPCVRKKMSGDACIANCYGFLRICPVLGTLNTRQNFGARSGSRVDAFGDFIGTQGCHFGE